MDRGRRPQSHPAVPKTTSVVPGAGVNIVLKADQPTGRTVSGVVRDVLTRGNHPRGIKVRLSDGRVGRVQSMLSSAGSSSVAATGAAPISSHQGTSSSIEDAGLVQGIQNVTIENAGGGSDGYADGAPDESSRGGRPRRGGRRGGRGGGDWSRRHDEDQELPSQQIGLDAYVKEARPKRKGKGNQPLAAQEEEEDRLHPSSASVTCPVCGAFEGDEEAVSHHVASHFDSAS